MNFEGWVCNCSICFGIFAICILDISFNSDFQNDSDATGSSVRLWDYYQTAEMVNQLPTVKEKIDFVNPYERPWTRAERVWRR